MLHPIHGPRGSSFIPNSLSGFSPAKKAKKGETFGIEMLFPMLLSLKSQASN